MMTLLGVSLFVSGFLSFIITRMNRLPGWISIQVWSVGGSFFLSSAYAFCVPKNLNNGFLFLSITFSVTLVSWFLHEYMKSISGKLSKVDERVIWGWVSYTLLMIMVVAWVVYIEPYKIFFRM
jgi:hypothetical protein